MQKIFGTDGVRGVFGEDITPDLAYNIGKAIAIYTKAEKNILIAKDTRLSSDVLLTAFTCGATSMGACVVYMGQVTTPCLSYTTKSYNFGCGVMITASHNQSEYNGIKIFKSNGEKLGAVEEKKLTHIFKNIKSFTIDRNSKCGKFSIKYGLTNKYITYLKSLVKDKYFEISVAFDCANGVPYKIISKIFDNNFKNVYFINTSQNGKKVNQNCGATDTTSLTDFVVKNSLDLGFAFDGDGDRVIAVDGSGKIFDGDDILYNLGLYFKKQNMLNKDTVVGTTMTNLGLERAFEKEGIKLLRVDVGDKYIVDKLVDERLSLGGEKAGHIIPKKYTNTGDGILTALVLLPMFCKYGLKKVENMPQKIVNIDCAKKAKERLTQNKELFDFLETKKKDFNECRVVVRPSGTENKIRVMVEGKDFDLVQRLLDEVCLYITKNCL